MRRVVLIRHGRTEANDRRLYCGASDLPLSGPGREALLALRARGGYPSVDGFAVYTTGLRRTEETLELLFGPMPHRTAPGLREVDFGAFEMRGYEELKDDPAFRRWCEGDNEKNVPPGGESGEQMTERVRAAFFSLLETGEDLLIVSHGGPIAAVMEALFPEEGRNRWQWQPANGEGYEITLSETPLWRAIPERGEDHG